MTDRKAEQGEFGEPLTHRGGYLYRADRNIVADVGYQFSLGSRMADCVNALRGIPDPEKFVEAVTTLRSASRFLLGIERWRLTEHQYDRCFDELKQAVAAFANQASSASGMSEANTGSEGKAWIGYASPGEPLQIKKVDAEDASFEKHFGGDGDE